MLNIYREKDEAMRTKFHDEYHPDTTDCQAELPFATGDSFTYKLGQISTLPILSHLIYINDIART